MPAKHFEDPDIYTGKYEANNTFPYYPPFLIFLLSKTLAHFVFPTAVLLHIASQVILLLAASYFVLRYYGLGIFILPVSLIYFMVLFLTPVGLSWFERGKFEIYPAISILLFMFAVYENKWYLFLAALFASIKWTVMPFFAQAFPIYLLFNYVASQVKIRYDLYSNYPADLGLLWAVFHAFFVVNIKRPIIQGAGLYLGPNAAGPSIDIYCHCQCSCLRSAAGS